MNKSIADCDTDKSKAILHRT